MDSAPPAPAPPPPRRLHRSGTNVVDPGMWKTQMIYMIQRQRLNSCFIYPPESENSPAPKMKGASKSLGSSESLQKAAKTRDWNLHLPLYRAALAGDWVTTKQIIDDDPSAMEAKLNFTQATALHIAVGAGNRAIHLVENLVRMMPDELIAAKDDIGDTALNIAAAVGNVVAAKILVNRMPSLLYSKNNSGAFPIHTTAIYAQKKALKYLISVTRDDRVQNPYAGSSGVSLLISVIDAEFFDVALELVNKYPNLARVKISTDSALISITAKRAVFRPSNFRKRLIFPPFPKEMALRHYSLDTGILTSNAKQDNIRGKIHLIFDSIIRNSGRSQRDEIVKHSALNLVKGLCKEIKYLTVTEAEDIYCDAILLAAQSGIYEIVEEIVKAFPSAIYCSNPVTFQNIFHIAVENRSEQVFNLIYQMSDHKHLFLDLSDVYGNNLLHLAGKLAPAHKLSEISGAALQMQREIQWFKAVEKTVHPHCKERLNNTGKCARTIFTEEHKDLKEKAEQWMKDTANSCTITAVLISTMMFAAAITVPGGNDNDSGYPMFSKNPVFFLFAASDAFSLVTSATSLLMFLDILTSRYAEEDFLYRLPERLILGLSSLVLSITSMLLTFCATVYLVFGHLHMWILIAGAVGACGVTWLFLFLQIPLLLDLITSTYGHGIFEKQGNNPFY